MKRLNRLSITAAVIEASKNHRERRRVIGTFDGEKKTPEDE
jgi:hypothetical protein